ncbi:MAG: RNA 2',3'-cyclic phosphodiesterase [Candidatus Nanoarchaeia archaeon]
MRVFIGIKLPQEVRDYIFDLEKEISKLPAKIKFVHKKNLHVTLKFIDEISEDKLKIVKDRLKKFKFKKFPSALMQLDFFPNKNNIRVLWAGIDNKNPFYDIQKQIDDDLRDILNPEEKFHPHITLGRIKFIKNPEEFQEKITNVVIKPLKFEINQFCLFESTLTKDGPEYNVLETYDLE